MTEPIKEGTAVPHDAGQAKVFPPLDPSTFAPQLIWLAIAFTALYILLSKFALPRVGDVIEERRDRIKRDLDTAERLKDDTQTALKAYEKSLADARANASGIAKETRDRLSGESDKEKVAIDKQIAAKLAEAEARISSTKTKALASVNDVAADTAGAMVKQLIGADVSADEVKRALASLGK
jgi:F-type H+-transporting ATPase subunit b